MIKNCVKIADIEVVLFDFFWQRFLRIQINDVNLNLQFYFFVDFVMFSDGFKEFFLQIFPLSQKYFHLQVQLNSSSLSAYKI